MAQRRTTIKFCDSCSRDVRATTTSKFALNGTEYEIDLCDKHADALQRDIMSWASIAQEIERPSLFARPDVVRDHTRRKIPQPASATSTSSVAAQSAPEPQRQPAISHAALEWHLTDHAEEQLAERGPKYGFSRADVFLCVSQPERVVDSPATAKGGRQQWFRNNVQLIVEPEDKVIVTVLPKSTRDFDETDTKYPRPPATSPFSHTTERFTRAAG